MRLSVRETVLGFALAAAGGLSAHAQPIVAPAAQPEVVAPAVGGTVIRRETREVITRPVETVGQAAPAAASGRALRRTTTRAVPRTRRVATTSRRTATRSAAVRLSSGQRETVYRTIVEERVVPSRIGTTGMAAPVAPVAPVAPAPVYTTTPAYVAPPAYAGAPDGYYYARTPDDYYYARPPAYVGPQYAAPPAYGYVAPTVPATTDVVTVPAAPVAPAPAVTTVAYAVGSTLPNTVPLYAVPAGAVARVPAIAGYRYAYVNGHVLLVDPASNIVVSEIY